MGTHMTLVSQNMKFILLNEDGDALDGVYIEFESMPSQAWEIGSAKYVDARVADKIHVKLSEDTTMLICWDVRTPDHTFMIKPIIDGFEIYGLEVQFDNSYIACFSLECDLDEPA